MSAAKQVSLPASTTTAAAAALQETYVSAYQARVDGFWRDVVHPNEPGITLEMYRYARSVVSSHSSSSHDAHALALLSCGHSTTTNSSSS